MHGLIVKKLKQYVSKYLENKIIRRGTVRNKERSIGFV